MATLLRSTICLCLLFFSVITLHAQGSWTAKTSYPGTARSGAVSFVIGGNAYVGLGNTGTAVKNDFWKYNPGTNSWTSIANFGGLARQNAVVFVVNDTAYVGLGDSGSPNYTNYKDIWKYDVTLNSWKKVADFGGTARTSAMAFSIGTKAYVGTGEDDTDALKDLWEYTPATNKWVKKNDITADKRKDAVGFAINGKGYLCSGWYTSPYSFILSDIQEYNPTTDTWIEKEFAAGSLNRKQWADYFILNNKAYLISGNNTNSVVVYDPATNSLSTETAFGPSGETGRSNVIAFAINNKGYAGLGIVDNTTYKNDFWQFSVPLPPAAPTNLTAVAIDNSKVTLTWKDNSNDETNFVVERSDNTNSAFVPIDTLNGYYATGTIITFNDKNLQDSSKYYYRVRAKNNIGYSSYSNEVAVITFALHSPKAPGNLRFENGNLRWDDNSTNESYFLVEMSENDNQKYYKIDSLKADYNYNYLYLKDSTGFFFRVRAKNEAGYSGYSNEVYLMTKAKAPKDLKAIPKSINEINLFWSDNSSVETGYVIERSENNNYLFQKIDTLPANNYAYNDRDVKKGITYYYRIAAIIRGKLVYGINEDSATPAEVGSWVELKDHPIYSGKYGVNFYYDSTVYSGFGYNEKQFFGYNLKTQTWEKKADLGENTWGDPVSMVINNKGFVCLGTFNQNESKKAWEYDFSANKWTQKNDVPFADRASAISFSLENKGYFLGGRDRTIYNKEYKDFYQYDITTDSWTQLADFPGGECSGTPVFVYNKKAYLFYKGIDLWEYSPITNTWVKIRTLTQSIPGNKGSNLREHFYFFNTDYNSYNSIYEYNFIKDEIIKKYKFPGTSYEMEIINDSTSLYAMAGYTYDNFWCYNPSLPVAPLNLTAKATSFTKVELNWIDETDLETDYVIERTEGNNYPYVYIVIDTLKANSTNFVDSTVLKDKNYTYRVRAKGDGGYSEYAYSSACKTKKPGYFDSYYLTTEYNKGFVQLNYRPDFTDNVQGVIIEKSEDKTTFTVIDTTQKNIFIDSLLTVGKTYYYRIKSFNNLGYSDYSNILGIIAGSISHSNKISEVKDGYYLDGGGLKSYSTSYYESLQVLKPVIAGEKISIIFKSFNLSSYDTLVVYNGVDENSPVLAIFHNNNKPLTKLCASNSSGALTFKLLSKYGFGEGWLAYFKSTAFPPPTNLLAKRSGDPVLTWNDNGDLETNFIIERSEADTSHFTTLLSLPANSITYTDTAADPTKLYYYRIKAVYSGGSSDFSNIAASNGTILNVPKVLKNSDISIFPNPANSNCTLRMNLSKSQNATVSVANITGMVLSSKNVSLQSGLNEIPLDIDGLPSGTYFVVIKSETDSVTKILTISR